MNALQTYQIKVLETIQDLPAAIFAPPRFGKGQDRVGSVDADTRRVVAGEHFPEYIDLLERLDDLAPVAAACARCGGHLHWPADATTRRKKKAHVEWVAYAAKIRVRQVKSLLKNTGRFAR